MAKLTKTLKECGVPFGARFIFRAQHTGFLIMACLMVLTLPVLLLLSIFYPFVAELIEGFGDVVDERTERVKRHREKLVRMYSEQRR